MFNAKLLSRMSAGRCRSFNRTYLSQEFKETMEKRLDIPQIDRSTKQLFAQTDKLIPFEIDSFINRLPKHEDRRGEIYEQLLKLRSSEYTTVAPDTIHHAVINYLVSINVEDLLSILSNRLQYGIFLDPFTGCYLMDILLEKENFTGAAQIAAEMLIQEDFENELVQALSLKSCFEYVRFNLKNSEGTSQEESAQKEEKVDKPVRVRVKFLRNPPENDMINTKNLQLSLMGKTLTRFSSKCSNDDLRHNGMLLGSVLSENFEETSSLLKQNSSLYNKDIIDLCLAALGKSTKLDDKIVENVTNSLKGLQSMAKNSYPEAIDAFIQQAKAKTEGSLIEQQKANYKKWLKEREIRFIEVLNNQKRFLRQTEIENTVTEIQNEKQKLWFFENQDKLDLDIFNKQVRYPKRWFGKKKKPRAVDDNYIPPEIRTK